MRQIKFKKGATLLTSVILIALMSLAAVGLTVSYTENVRSNAADVGRLQAKYMVYSGVNYALYQYIEVGVTEGDLEVNKNSAFKWYTKQDEDTLYVIVKAYVGSWNEEITVTYDVSEIGALIVTKDATKIGSKSAVLNMTFNFRDYVSGTVRFMYRPEGKEWGYTKWIDQKQSGSYAETVDVDAGLNYEFYAQLTYKGSFGEVIVDGATKTFATDSSIGVEPKK